MQVYAASARFLGGLEGGEDRIGDHVHLAPVRGDGEVGQASYRGARTP